MANWTAEERTTLKTKTTDGMKFSDLQKIFPNRSFDAIRKKIYALDYGIKTIDGIKTIYKGLNTRKRKKKEEITTIVGESRTAPTVQEPTTSERTYQNISDDIVAESDANSAKEQVFELYDILEAFFNSDNFPDLQSAYVVFNNSTFTLSKDLL